MPLWNGICLLFVAFRNLFCWANVFRHKRARGIKIPAEFVWVKTDTFRDTCKLSRAFSDITEVWEIKHKWFVDTCCARSWSQYVFLTTHKWADINCSGILSYVHISPLIYPKKLFCHLCALHVSINVRDEWKQYLKKCGKYVYVHICMPFYRANGAWGGGVSCLPTKSYLRYWWTSTYPAVEVNNGMIFAWSR